MRKISVVTVLYASQGLALTPGLPARAIMVGVALLRHLNRSSGRCDPSIDLLCRALDLSRSSVQRAISDLRAWGLFEVITHGGSNGTNSYVPNFKRLIRTTQDYDVASGITKEPSSAKKSLHMVKREAPHHVKQPPPQHVTSKPVEITRRRNHGDPGTKTAAQKAEKSLEAGPGKYRNRTRAPDKILEMRNAAERRLERDVTQSGDLEALYLADAQAPGSWAKAIEAEMKNRGTGIEVLKRAALCAPLKPAQEDLA